MWVFPLVAAVISLAFAAALGRQALRGRPAEAMWTIALLMYAAASAAMFLGSLANWTAAEFRVYWLLGATLTVPCLAQGELYLLAPRSVANALLVPLAFGTAFATARLARAPMQLAFLHEQLPLGKDVFGAGTAAHRLPQLYSIPAYAVLCAGAAWSGWRMRRRSEARGRMVGTIAIAAGATVVAIGSGIGAGYGFVWLFSVALAAGVAVMFWGFLRATPMARARSAPP